MKKFALLSCIVFVSCNAMEKDEESKKREEYLIQLAKNNREFAESMFKRGVYFACGNYCKIYDDLPKSQDTSDKGDYC